MNLKPITQKRRRIMSGSFLFWTRRVIKIFWRMQTLSLSQRKFRKISIPSKLLGLTSGKKLIFLAADEESELYKVLKKNDLVLFRDW